MTGNTEQTAVQQAFQLWSAYTPLTFTLAANASSADIVISWAIGNHGDGHSFDGTDGVLAHSYYPGTGLGGDIHFDDAETWINAIQNTSAQPIDLVSVAAHEIGHALGLGHSNVNCALMNALYTGSHRYLAPDDIAGIRSLYGSKGIVVANYTCSGANLSFNAGSGVIGWTSNHPNIATVNNQGVVTRNGTASGVVRITANIAFPCGLGDVEFVDLAIGVPPSVYSFTTLTSSCLGGSDWELLVQANNNIALPAGTQFVWNYNGVDGAPTGNTFYTYEFPAYCINLGAKNKNTCGTSLLSSGVFCPPPPCGGMLLSVSPNPATNFLNVTIQQDPVQNAENKAPVQFELVDIITGNIVKQWPAQSAQKVYNLNLTGVTKGNYLLKITKGSERAAKKILVE
jgi:hypothetical protein